MRASGFALVETLVATLVVATGALGVAALHVASLAGARESAAALGAVGHVAAHVERLRALHDLPPAARAELAGPGRDAGCRAAPCAPAEFAALAAWLWRTHLPATVGDAVPRLDVGADGTAALVLQRGERTLVRLDVTP